MLLKVAARARLQEMAVRVRGLFNHDRTLIKSKWTVKEAGIKSGENLFVELMEEQPGNGKTMHIQFLLLCVVSDNPILIHYSAKNLTEENLANSNNPHVSLSDI